MNYIKVYYNLISKFLVKNKLYLVIFLISALNCIFWLLVFFPGNMSLDSIVQWGQSVDNQYDNLHPFVFSILIHILRMLWNSPAVVVLFQLLSLSLLLSYILGFLANFDNSKKFLVSTFVFIQIFFPIYIMNTTIWKDILYTYGILLISFIFYKCYISKKLISNTELLLLLVSAYPVISFRHNGLIYILFIPVIFLISRLITYRKALFVTISLILMVLFNQYGLPHFFKITQGNELSNKLASVKIVARSFKSGYIFSSQNNETIVAIAPPEVWNKYVCYNDYELVWAKNFNRHYLEDTANNEKWNNVVKEAIIYDTQNVIGDRLCVFANLMAGRQFLDMGIPNNDYGLYAESKIEFFKDPLNKILSWSLIFPQRFIFWSPALFAIVYTIFFLFSLRNKLIGTLGYIFFNIVNIVPIFLLAPSAEYRYVYSIVLSGILLPIIAYSEFKLKDK